MERTTEISKAKGNTGEYKVRAKEKKPDMEQIHAEYLGLPARESNYVEEESSNSSDSVLYCATSDVSAQDLTDLGGSVPNCCNVTRMYGCIYDYV